MSSSTSDDPSGAVETGTKRKKVNTISKVKSCAECRRLKLRCDCQQPCNNCTRRGTGSICPDGALKPAKGRTLILESSEALHDRIALLEQALHQFTSTNGGHSLLENAFHLEGTLDVTDHIGRDDLNGPVFLESDHTEVEERARDNNLSSIPPTLSSTIVTQQPLSASNRAWANQGAPEDRSGHLQADEGDMRTSRFFGDASSLFLADHGRRVSATNGMGPSQPYGFRKGWIEGFMFEADSALRFEHSLADLVAQLPPRVEAQRLMEIYFDHVSWGSNILLKSTFAGEYFDRFYDGSRGIDAQKLAVLYLTLALGALFDARSPAGADNNPLTCDLFVLGRASLALDSYGTIIFVQAIHLMVTWLNNGGRPVPSSQSTWPLIGMGMRVVQALGLHRDGKYFQLPESLAEERRRIFWELYSCDIANSVASARPRSMTSGTYDVDFPATPPGGEHYHEYRYRLCLLETQINDEQSRISTTPYERVAEIDREFRKFQQQLPPELFGDESSRPSQQTSAEMTRHIRRLTMRWRFDGSLESWNSVHEEPLRSEYCPSYVGCLEACKLILGDVRRLAVDAPLIFERRWFLLLHAFTACVCLSAAVIRAPRSMLAQSSLTALEEGIKLFEIAGKQDEHAILLPLRDTARRSFLQSGAAAPASDEDLALIGKRRRQTGYSSSQSPISPLRMQQSDARNTVAHNTSNIPQLTFASEWGPGGNASTSDFSQSHTNDEINIASQGDSTNLIDSSDQLDWSANNPAMGAFDIESFMATFGLGNVGGTLGTWSGTSNWNLSGE